MASKLLFMGVTGLDVYALIQDTTGQAWYTTTPALEAYNASHYSAYAIALTETPSGSGRYDVNIPALPAGAYAVTYRLGASPAQSDPILDSDDLYWDGSAVNDILTSVWGVTLSDDETGRPTTALGKLAQVWMRFFNKVTQDTSDQTVYQSDGSTPAATMPVSQVSGLQTKGSS